MELALAAHRPRQRPLAGAAGVTRLRVGVVGSGIGASHIEAYTALPDHYEVAALCDIDAVRGAAVAEKFAIPATVEPPRRAPRATTSTSSTSAPRPACTRPRRSPRSRPGFHTVVEKPVAKSLAELDAVEAAEAASGRRVCPIFQYRFGHGIQKLHHLIGKGLAGRPSVATAETHWYRGDVYYGAAAWRGTFDGELGGCLTTHAIHIHDMLCEVLGPARLGARPHLEPRSTATRPRTRPSSRSASPPAPSPPPRSPSARARRPRACASCFDDLVAESGLAPYNPGHDPWTFPHDDPAAAAAIEAALADFAPQPERFVGQFHRMHPALTAGGPLPVTLADARRSIELLTAAYYSALTGEPVAAAAAPDHPFYAGWLDAMKQEAAHG